MSLRALALSLAFLCIGCQSSGELKPVSQLAPGVAEEGSLANQQLIRDTTAGLASAIKDSEITSETKVLKFVIQQPVGEPGSRAWREMWVVDPEGLSRSFLITFRESGLGAANFEIQQMQNQTQ